jgi:HK97 family phage major capsid protein
MPFDNIISRTDVAATVPEDVASTILSKAVEQSAAMTLFRRVRMSREQQRMPVLAAIPVAYFVNGDTGLKQTTEAAWANKYLDAEEIACIVPIPEAVLDDTTFDVWGEIRPLIEEAVGRTLDAAIFFGVNKPSIWPKSIVDIADDAGNTIVRGTHTAAEGGIAEDFNDLFSAVETKGFDVNGLIANRIYRGLLRGARNANGDRLDDVSPGEVYGETVTYPMRGMWPTGASAVEAIAGDFSQGILGVRQDITYKILDQAVIQDNTGAIIYNLAQQDMVAMRVVSRFAFQVANIVNFDEPDEELRSPWAIMTAPAA